MGDIKNKDMEAIIAYANLKEDNKKQKKKKSKLKQTLIRKSKPMVEVYYNNEVQAISVNDLLNKVLSDKKIREMIMKHYEKE